MVDKGLSQELKSKTCVAHRYMGRRLQLWALEAERAAALGQAKKGPPAPTCLLPPRMRTQERPLGRSRAASVFRGRPRHPPRQRSAQPDALSPACSPLPWVGEQKRKTLLLGCLI